MVRKDVFASETGWYMREKTTENVINPKVFNKHFNHYQVECLDELIKQVRVQDLQRKVFMAFLDIKAEPVFSICPTLRRSTGERMENFDKLEGFSDC